MEIANTKLELMSLLLKEQKESVLAKIKAVFEEEKPETDWWDKLTGKQKAGIEEGKKKADAGELIPHEEVMKAFDKWNI